MSPGLMTDLYHPDAAYVSWKSGVNGDTTFDLYVRSAPFGGAFLLVAGIEMALEFVRTFQYSEDDLAYLAQVRGYEPGFLQTLRDLRFSGEVAAMSEGSVAFPNEPFMRVTAPFRESILLESGLLQAVGPATLIATKAARVVHAARGRPVAEFWLRRAQAPLVATRAAAIGGCVSTSFLAAAKRYDLPPSGTIPHALVQLFDSEAEGFRAVAESFDRYTLLLDTYDVLRAIHTAVEVARDVQERMGHTLDAVRLDSGDVAADARAVRVVLDNAGLTSVRILASGDLDEFTVAALVESGAPIDSFGVGTSIAVGAGNPSRNIPGAALGTVYKEVWSEGGRHTAKVKVAGDKSTWPGRKQVYRIGAFEEDVIALDTESPPARGRPQLRTMIRDGGLLPNSTPPLAEVIATARTNLEALPERYRDLNPPEPYPVRFSDALVELRRQTIGQYRPNRVGLPASS
ncbi:MAG: nicotinate phosphoribosyltransferase [Dehalococcoidia bacterium]